MPKRKIGVCPMTTRIARVEVKYEFTTDKCADEKSVEMVGSGAFTDTALKAVRVSSGDSDRIKKLFEDSTHKIGGVEFIEREVD